MQGITGFIARIQARIRLKALLSRVMVNAGWLFVSSLYDYATSFILTLLVARPVGPAEFGIITLVNSIIEIPRLVLVTTLGTSMAKHIAAVKDSESDVKRLAQVGFLLIISLTSLTSLALFLCSSWFAVIFHNPRLMELVRIGALVVFLSGLMSFVQSILQGINRLDQLAQSQLANSTLKVLVTLLLFYSFNQGVKAVLWGNALAATLVSIPFFFIVLNQTHFHQALFQRVEGPMLQSVVKYSVPLFISSLAFYAFTRIDTVILGYYAKEQAQIGNFGIATAVFSVFLIVAQSFASATFPMVSHLYAIGETKRLQQLFGMVMNSALIYSIPAFVGVVLVAPSFFRFLMPEYEGSVFLLQLMAPLIIIRTIGAICPGGFLTPAGYARDVAILTIVSGAANIIADLILIPPFGAAGSVIGTLIVHTLNAIAAVALVNYRLKLKPYLALQPLFFGLVMFLIAFIASRLLKVSDFPNMLVLFTAGFAAYLFLVVKFDRNFISSITKN